MKATEKAISVLPRQREPALAYLGLGANLGDPVNALRQALKALRAMPHSQVTAVSSLYSSAPVDANGPDYTNAVVGLTTYLGPMELLHHLQAIEIQHGRQRLYRNAPRTLDLDLLRFGMGCINAPTLTVPHPRMYERAFVLLPLAEVAPHLVSAERLSAVAGQPIRKCGSFAELDGR